MKNISVFIKGGKETLTKPLLTHASLLTTNEVTVFWKFKNITNDLDNRKISKGTQGNQEFELEEGYWDFHEIKERLDEEKLKLSMNVHDNTCTIVNESGSVIDLKNLENF